MLFCCCTCMTSAVGRLSHTQSMRLVFSLEQMFPDVIFGINYLTVGHVSFEWTHVFKLKLLGPLWALDDEHLINSLFSLSGIWWCQLCGWNSKGMYVHGCSELPLASWVCPDVHSKRCNWVTFSLFFPSGNDSVMAPSAHSHSHPLQNRTFQVPLPNQGLFFYSFIYFMTMNTNWMIKWSFFVSGFSSFSKWTQWVLRSLEKICVNIQIWVFNLMPLVFL